MRLIILLALISTSLIIGCKSEADNSAASTDVKKEQKQDHPAIIKNKPKVRSARSKTDHMNTGGMQWMSFEEAVKKGNNDGKKYLVDVYTEWCGWCKVMDKKTFSDPGMQDYLKENFHIIKFDAEQKEEIDFRGKTYKWIPTGRKGVNELAVELLGSRMSYPTIVYLDKNMNKIRSSPGFKDVNRLLAELKSL